MSEIKMLYSPVQIQTRIDEISGEIEQQCLSKELVLIGLLNGSFAFMADLARALHKRSFSLKIDFMKVSSYGGETTSSGEVRLEKDIRLQIHDRHVLLVDDILDTGNSLSSVLKIMETHHPRSIQTCVLLDKPDRHEIHLQPDYIGFEVPNQFVVGYGLDFAEQYRELPYIGILES